MAATTPLSINFILDDARRRLPDVTFVASTDDAWDPTTQTVSYNATADAFDTLLHEIGHASLGHQVYQRDIELLDMELAAWQHAQAIASEIGVSIDENTVQADLDTYRDWLHARSTCPQCSQNGVQTNTQEYACPVCDTHWRVNEARTCGLKRYRQNK